VPIFKGSTSRGAHVAALAAALQDLIDFLPDAPSERRVRLRTHLAALKRAYPELNGDVALMQHLEEEDGIPQDDSP